MKSFTKKNNTPYEDALLVEYKGLLQLQKLFETIDEIKIPHIIKHTKNGLKMEMVSNSSPNDIQMRKLGIGLAKMHKKSFERYGLSYDNYIGLNSQQNGVYKEWGEFFLQKRLITQINMIKNRELKTEFSQLLKKHHIKLENFLNDTTKHPSLVHGDLWSGNVLFSKNDVYLIDPAIYFSDREVDIAMSEMFGGFWQSFYESYNDTYPLSEHYSSKKEIYNLYHFLNHYNLFGRSYLGDCIRIFELIERL